MTTSRSETSAARVPGCVCTDPSLVLRAGHERRCPLFAPGSGVHDPLNRKPVAADAHDRSPILDLFEQATVDSFIGFCGEHDLDEDDAYLLLDRVMTSLYGAAQERYTGSGDGDPTDVEAWGEVD